MNRYYQAPGGQIVALPSGQTYFTVNVGGGSSGGWTQHVYINDRDRELPPPLEDAGLSVGEIIAYRMWRIEKNGYLRSGAQDVQWIPGVPMAGDPEDRNGSGVYAFKRPNLGFHQAMSDYYGTYGIAVGTVALYGRVIEHSQGYRAEYAMINTIEAVIGLNIEDHAATLQLVRSVYCDGEPLPADHPILLDEPQPTPEPPAHTWTVTPAVAEPGPVPSDVPAILGPRPRSPILMLAAIVIVFNVLVLLSRLPS